MRDFKEGDVVMLHHACSGTETGKRYALKWGSKGSSNKNQLFAWDDSMTNSQGCACTENFILTKPMTRTETITKDDLKPGVVLVTKSGNVTRTVLSEMEGVVAYSHEADHTKFDGQAPARHFLNGMWFKVVPGPREVTMAEVCKEFGEEVVIKKD